MRPLHPAVVHFPVACWVLAALLRPRLGPAPALVVSLEVLGTVALVIGGHYAASVVFSVLPSVHASRDAPSDLATFKESKP